jgi:transcriptional regulator with XRE-family HTH domain
MTNLKVLGKIYKNLRDKSGLTQKQLADKVQLSTNMISTIENGKNDVGLQNYEIIAKFFKVSFLSIYVKSNVNPQFLHKFEKEACLVYTKRLVDFTNRKNEDENG